MVPSTLTLASQRPVVDCAPANIALVTTNAIKILGHLLAFLFMTPILSSVMSGTKSSARRSANRHRSAWRVPHRISNIAPPFVADAYLHITGTIVILRVWDEPTSEAESESLLRRRLASRLLSRRRNDCV
jgi:hypothetical protein